MKKSSITILMIPISSMNPISMLKIPMKVLVLVDQIVSVVLFFPLLVDNHPIASAKVGLLASGHPYFFLSMLCISHPIVAFPSCLLFQPPLAMVKITAHGDERMHHMVHMRMTIIYENDHLQLILNFAVRM